jgi:hypothetical protein
VFGKPGRDGVREVVFPDEGFADYVGVCEGGGWVGEEVSEVEGFVGGDLEDWS